MLKEDFESFVMTRLEHNIENVRDNCEYQQVQEKRNNFFSGLPKGIDDIVNYALEIETEIFSYQEKAAYKQGFFDCLKLLYCF